MIIRPAARSVNAVPVLLALACVLVGLDMWKPLYIDDAFLYGAAERIARHPTDPYGFDTYWYQWPQPMIEELAPPVLPYWWAAGIRMFGERPLLWKLWLLPFGVMLCLSLHALLRRFAPRAALPATAMLILSPAVLPGLNLMGDLPALALGLTGLVCYLRASETDRMRWALAAGAVLGLAGQTKYTALTVVAAIGVHALLRRRLRLGFVAAAVAGAVFFGWEGLMVLRYGHSMFFGQLGIDLFWSPRGEMAWAFITLVGGSAPLLALLGPAGRWPRFAAAAGAAMVAGFGLLQWRRVENDLFLALGAAFAGIVSVACVRLFVRPADGAAGPDRRTDAFLVLWLAIETVGYFFTAPFGAVRRVLGPVVVSVLIVARAVSPDLARPGGRRRLVPLVALNAMLALLFVVVDTREAEAQRASIDAAVDWVRARDPASTVWYVGHWGFDYYAPRAGMRRLIPDHTYVREGDWIAVPKRVDKPVLAEEPRGRELRRVILLDDALRLETKGYYGGRWPIGHLAEPRMLVSLYRVSRDGIPRTGWSVFDTAQFARVAGGETASWTVPALVRALGETNPAARLVAAEVLGELGRRARGAGARLAALLETEPERAVRVRAAVALGRIGDRGAEVREALVRAAADPEVSVRAAATEALALLLPAPAGGPAGARP